MNNQSRALFMVQLPPPVHGSSSISKTVIDSKLINATFQLKTIPLNFARNMTDLGSFSLNKFFKMISYLLRVLSALLRFRPSMVYFTISPIGMSFYRDLVYVFILKLFDAKIIYHLHVKGIQQECIKSKVKQRLYRWAFKNTFVITLSSRIAEDLIGVYDGKPFIVNNGIASRFKCKVATADSSPGTPRTLLYLSNLMRAKGIFVFLESLVLLKNNHFDFLARIIGMPSDVTKEQVESFVNDKGLTRYVKVEDAKYGDEKYDAFQHADIFVHPTLNDAFPLVILEAMQSQLPVISTLEGAIPEIVEDGVTGFLVAKNDAKGLMEKIAVLLTEDDLRKKMGMNGRTKYLSHYTSEKMEQDLNNVLLEISSLKQHNASFPLSGKA